MVHGRFQYERGKAMNTNLKEKVIGVTLTKACGIKPDGDSTESKTIQLEVKFDGVLLEDVFSKAMSSTVITWQNGVGRKQFTTYKANQVVKVDFKAPASKPQVDPVTAMIQMAAAAGMSVEDYLRAELAKRS
jgi:hypothetical protein